MFIYQGESFLFHISWFQSLLLNKNSDNAVNFTPWLDTSVSSSYLRQIFGKT